MLLACTKEEPVYTVGEADNAIVFHAGSVEGRSATETKALDANHTNHHALTSGIKLRLKVDGTWTGKSPESISKTTTAAVGAETSSGSKHNSVSFTSAEVLYWDDYGTADPANTTNRNTGLSVLAVAVNDKNQAAMAAPSDWTALPWALESDQRQGWTKKDLLLSYNLQSGSGNDGTLKFDDYKKKLAGTSGFENVGLLEFRHAMSKITINLKANKGFVNSKFVDEPTVELHGFYQSGTVNITDGAVSSQSGHQDSGSNPTSIKTYCETSSPAGKTNVTRSALVVPGTTLGGTEHIATVTADGNIYKISAAKLYAAMTASGGPGSTLKSGYNYILNITVDKTEVHVSATVVNWVEVSAAEDTPKIDVTMNYGEDGGNFAKGFSFYYSKSKGYDSSVDFYGTGPTNDIYGADRTVSYNNGDYTFDTELYWPDHSTKYFFRGIWPLAGTTANDPKVMKFNNGTKDCQGIPVANAKYEGGTYPSDLMLGIPLRTTEDPTHKTEPADGIGATEGTVSLTFKYRMAQVEIRLMSSGSDKSDNIDFGSNGGAELATVKIVNGYKDAYILMDDGSVSYASGATRAEYQMTPKSSDISTVSLLTASEYSSIDWSGNHTLQRHDSVIPQKLDDATYPVKFVITTGPAGNKDTYTIDVKDIIVSSVNNVAQPSGSKITKWEAGKHYVYTLKITKTQMKIEATIVDWVPVVAGGDFWL